MSESDTSWLRQNQRHLMAAIEAVRLYMEQRLEAGLDARGPEVGMPALDLRLETYDGFVSSIDRVTRAYGLSSFEQAILLLCAGVELDGRMPALLARAQGEPRRTFPSFGLVMALLPEAHWSALGPNGPLRRWRLIEVGAGEGLTQSPLRIDERLLHYLVGLDGLDARLDRVVEPVGSGGEVVPSQMPLVDRLAASWSSASSAASVLPILCGGDSIQRRAIAAEGARRLGMTLHRWRVMELSSHHQDLAMLQRLWEREAVLLNSVLVLEWPEDAQLQRVASSLVELLRCPLVVSAREAPHFPGRATIRLDVESPGAEERAMLWRRYLGPTATGMAEQLDTLVAQFHLGPTAIQAASAEALAQAGPALPLDKALWAACRSQSRPRLDELAQRVDSLASWDELVLPPQQLQLLREIAVQVRHRGGVYDKWGFAERSHRGLGINVLFSGPSGTGKTMAAEVLATELELDLYRIDLSQVVSKYIGETEKNLRRIFDAADEGGVILLFDEADSLFGKRSEVRDSHDRYANLEVSYLLQRMEAYRGLAILTTNFKNALDTAFMRRLRFVVQFPFPDVAQRQEMWRRVFPRKTPLATLDYQRLARVNVAGGNIRNIALNAAFMAAAEGAPVGMAHLLRSTRMEFAKQEKTLIDAEVAGWV
jgi:hypothetical protein